MYDVLHGYLTGGIYPSKYDIKKRKAVHYRVHNVELFYIGGKTQPQRVITDEEKRCILESCHEESEGIAYRYVALH